MDQKLLPYVPQIHYLLVDEGRLVRSGALPSSTLASLLLRLEHNKGIDDAQDLMQTVWDSTTGSEYAELRTAFTAYAKYVLLPRALPNVKLLSVDR